MSRLHLLITAVLCSELALLGASSAHAQQESPTGAKAIVARVGDHPIHTGDVDRLLAKVTGGQEVNPAVLPMLKAQVLSEIVDRRLIMAYARRTRSGASRQQVDAAVEKLKSKLAAQGRSHKDLFPGRPVGEAGLRRQIAWNLTWEKLLARYVTEKRLQEYFQAHRREFDGTELSVSHILLRPAADAGPEAWQELVEQAEAIRASIASGETTFAEAAREHSAGPSGAKGGELGFIARRGAMVEAFARAAFALQPDQISRPVSTRFGVHLIRPGEIKPGNKQWTDVRQQLEEALARELIAKLAEYERKYTRVEFSGKSPYFKPGTKELIVPVR